MNRWVPALILLAAGCKSYPYVVLLEGEWSGTANESTGNAWAMTADFSFDDEKEYFYGDVDIDGWLYAVDGVSSNKKAAEMTLLSKILDPEGNSVRTLALEKVAVDDEDRMEGDFSVDTCGGAAGEGCVYTGSFTMEMAE